MFYCKNKALASFVNMIFSFGKRKERRARVKSTEIKGKVTKHVKIRTLCSFVSASARPTISLNIDLILSFYITYTYLSRYLIGTVPTYFHKIGR